MKLKNKKTGDMGIINYFDNQSIVIYPIDENWNAKGDKKYVYHSLAELNEEWEDYEEPKEDYIRVIESFIHYVEEADESFYCDESVKKFVEKLKAWKRLKEAQFAFSLPSYNLNEDSSIIGATGSVGFSFLCYEDFDDDLDLLFSREDD